MEEKKHRIAYAFFSDSWVYGKSDPELLEKQSAIVIPEEFTEEMKGKAFCPICKTPLTRSPDLAAISTNSITAHFKHGSKSKYPESLSCAWRAPSAQGLRYETEEEAWRAIENKDLAIVSGWMDSPPTEHDDVDEQGEYHRTAIEDEHGPLSNVPIGRHKGKNVELPSLISTVMALCREFPENLRKGYFFPNATLPMLLSDQLYSVDAIRSKLPANETLFFGKITKYGRLTYRNVITLTAKNLSEVKIYTEPSFDERKKIDGSAIGRYMLFSAKMYWESQDDVAACKVIKWGAYSLLPEKYNKFLPGLT